MHLLPAHVLFRLRGRLDDRRRAAALHRHGSGPPVHRPPRCSLVGFAFAHLLDFKLMPRRKNIGSAKLYRPAAGGRHLAAPGAGAVDQDDQDDQLGSDPPAVRPDREVHHRPAPGHCRGRTGPAPLHPRRTEAPHLPGDRGTRAGGAYGVRLRLPRRRRAAARDPRGLAGGGELEQREQGPLLRQGRRPGRGGQGIPGGVHARPAPAPVRPRARQHAADATGPRRREVGRHAHRRRPAGPVTAVLDAREPLRPVRAGDDSRLDLAGPVALVPSPRTAPETEAAGPGRGVAG